MMDRMCLKSRWLWMYQQISSTLPGCAGVQEVGFPWAPTTHGGVHVNSSTSTSAGQLCVSPSTETYSVTGISFLIKTICSHKPNFVHLGCSVPCEHLHNAATLDVRFSILSLLWPEQSPHCWKTLLLGALELSFCEWLKAGLLSFLLCALHEIKAKDKHWYCIQYRRTDVSKHQPKMFACCDPGKSVVGRATTSRNTTPIRLYFSRISINPLVQVSQFEWENLIYLLPVTDPFSPVHFSSFFSFSLLSF